MNGDVLSQIANIKRYLALGYWNKLNRQFPNQPNMKKVRVADESENYRYLPVHKLWFLTK